MKSIYPNIKFTSSYLLVALGFVLAGYFRDLIFFTSLILVHEFGHYLIGMSLGNRSAKIYIYPFGGLTKFDSFINQKIYHSFLISIAGIIFQMTFYYFLFLLFKEGIIFSNSDFSLIKKYHYSMLMFNILPIIPLDGSKILECLLNKYFPYKISMYLLICISLISLLLFETISLPFFDYNYLIIGIILFSDIYKFKKNIKYNYSKFLLERYLYHFKFRKLKKIDKVSMMYQERRHLIYNNKKYVTEREILQKMFDLW